MSGQRYGLDARDLNGAPSPAPESRIDAAQADFWKNLGGRPVEPEEARLFGVEYLTDHVRHAEIRRLYPCPTVVDVGNGIFGAVVGLLYVDDDTGRAIAYAPPTLLVDHRRERRQRGLCPACGGRVRLVGNTTDGRHIGSCGDAFFPRQWRSLQPRRLSRTDRWSRDHRDQARARS